TDRTRPGPAQRAGSDRTKGHKRERGQRRCDRPLAEAPRGRGGYDLLAGVEGQALWYQVEPSFTWLPLRRIRFLHFGQVPIPRPLLRSRRLECATLLYTHAGGSLPLLPDRRA